MAALRLICGTIRRKFAKVPMMSTEQLLEIMNSKKTDRHLVLLDVREEEEFKVSQLRGAILVNPSTKDMPGVIKQINENAGGTEQFKTVVAYCAVGYRASVLIQRLVEHLEKTDQDAELMDLFNLDGSIFKWASEGKELVQPVTGKNTTVVHPYSEFWGKVLDAKLRSYEPEP